MDLYGPPMRHRRSVGIVTPLTAVDSVADYGGQVGLGPSPNAETSMVATITIIFGSLAQASAIDWAIERADRRRRSEDWRNYRA